MTELASRVMRARYSFGSCPSCGLAVKQGQQIGKIAETGAWHHTQCLVRGCDADDWPFVDWGPFDD